MAVYDTRDGYGIVSRLLHWIMAVVIVAMFVLGLWMVGLDYYDPYYKSAPDLHRSVGILLLIALALRFLWRVLNPQPDDSFLTRFEQQASRLAQWGFYPLLLALSVSGYFISTLDGRGIDVFSWFTVPSVLTSKDLEEVAGKTHEILAYATIALAVVHAGAALKHHFVDKNTILTRMWSGPAHD